MALPIRILTAVPICDGHDSAITTPLIWNLSATELKSFTWDFMVISRDMVHAGGFSEQRLQCRISSFNQGCSINFFADVVPPKLKKKGAKRHRGFPRWSVKHDVAHNNPQQMKHKGVNKILLAGGISQSLERFGNKKRRV